MFHIDVLRKKKWMTNYFVYSQTEATSIAHHPTQKHIVVAGGGDGSLTVWDLRYNTYPTSQLSAHSKSVSEILFHKDRPDNLFSCSISGEVWHWNNTQQSKLKLGKQTRKHDTPSHCWCLQILTEIFHRRCNGYALVKHDSEQRKAPSQLHMQSPA